MDCLRCGKYFHACPSCDSIGAEWEYCSKICWESHGSPEYTYTGTCKGKMTPEEIEEYLRDNGWAASFWLPQPVVSTRKPIYRKK